MMPWPARISGRLAELRSSTARIEFGLSSEGRARLGGALQRGGPIKFGGSLLRVLGDVERQDRVRPDSQ